MPKLTTLLCASLLAVPLVASADAPPKGPDFTSNMPGRGVDASLVASHGAAIPPSDDVVFLNDSWTLMPVELSRIDQTARWLRSHENFRVVLEGHASSPGSAAYNEDLATQRAKLVKQHLTARGISASRIVLVIYGENGAQLDPNPNDRRVVMYATQLPVAKVVSASLDRQHARYAAWTGARGIEFTEQRLVPVTALSQR